MDLPMQQPPCTALLGTGADPRVNVMIIYGIILRHVPLDDAFSGVTVVCYVLGR